MSEFNFDRAGNWDLQAIIKGQNTGSSIMGRTSSYAWLDSLDLEDYNNCSQENATLLNELEQLCQPFHHDRSSNDCQQVVLHNAMFTSMDQKYAKCVTNEPKPTSNVFCASSNLTTATRRRKNKHKMTMVQQPAGDRVSSDKWNWRKYGEKVIKGSPYPRSYYRCSNLGGCLARKQVEQSNTDPGIFLITYIDEHNHPYPTRRPSQAGRSSARKLYASAKVHTTNETKNMSTRASIQSPTVEEKVILIQQGDKEYRTMECVGEEGVYVPNRVFEDQNFFTGLEYLEGLDMDLICDMSLQFDPFQSNVK